jgi:O-antigen ligase
MQKTYRQITHQLTILSICLAAFSINLPTRFMDLSLSLLFIFWVISGNFKNKIQRLKENPGALVALGFFIFIGLGVLYSSAPIERAIKSGWLRYVGLLSIPIIVSVLKEKKYREYALHAFIFSSMIELFLSYGKWIGFIPLSLGIDAGAGNYVTFKYSIAHNIFLAYATYLMLNQFILTNHYKKYIWGALVVLSIFNIFYLVDSRTGQIGLLAMLTLFFYRHYAYPGLKKYFLGLIFIIIGALQFGHLNSRMFDIGQEIKTAQTEKINTSSGERLEFWMNTFTLIKRHPIFGGGTGSQMIEYETIPDDKKVLLKNGSNPHNHYLLMTQELGLIGLIALLTFFKFYWDFSLSFKPNAEALQAVVLLVGIGSLFNCMLWAGEGKFFYVLAGILLSAYVPKPKKVVTKHRQSKKAVKLIFLGCGTNDKITL